MLMNELSIFLLVTFYLHFASWSNNCSNVGLAKENNAEGMKSVSRFDVLFI